MIIGTPRMAEQVLAPFFADAEGELLAVLHLGPGSRLLALTIEEPGSADEVELMVASILRKALRIGAEGLILAHNHPSGDPTPSRADEAATRALAAAAAHVDIRIHEHLVFGGGESCSFRELGLL
jgi:DNA repair protein RadC